MPPAGHGRRTGFRGRVGAPALLGVALATLVLGGCAAAPDPAAELVGRWAGACSSDPTFRELAAPFVTELRPDGAVRETPGADRWRIERDRIVLLRDRGDMVSSGQFAFAGSVLRLNGLVEARTGVARWCNLSRA